MPKAKETLRSAQPCGCGVEVILDIDGVLLMGIFSFLASSTMLWREPEVMDKIFQKVLN